MNIRLLCAAAAAVLGLACVAASAGPAAKDKIALFQTRTIFHSGLRDDHTVAFTFDDGPNANTPAVLDVLKQYNIKATFFVVGRMAHAHRRCWRGSRRKAISSPITAATHPMLGGSFDAHPERLIEQLQQVNDEIAPLMKPTDKLYFRAPSARGARRMRRSSIPIRCCATMSARSIGTSAATSSALRTATS